MWFSCGNGNDIDTSCIHSSRYSMAMIWSGKPKIIGNMVLEYQWEGCIHILHTQFPLVYGYYLEWKTESHRKYGSRVSTGRVYAHSVYTNRVNE